MSSPHPEPVQGDPWKTLVLKHEARILQLVAENSKLTTALEEMTGRHDRLAAWHTRHFEAAECDLAALQENILEMTTVLRRVCDRSWEDETPVQVANIAANAIQNRDDEIAHLRASHAQAIAQSQQQKTEKKR